MASDLIGGIVTHDTIKMVKEQALCYMYDTYAGTWYSWGGDSPDGFDCSGMAIEYLKAGLLLPRKYDNTANGLMVRYSNYAVTTPYRGCLAFRLDGVGRAVHVAICLNEHQVLDASGGTSKTKTREDAIRDNAFIKVRGSYRVFDVFVDPFLSLRIDG